MFDQIPQELKDLKQWIVWKLEIGKDERLTKVPYRIDLPGAHASTTNPKSWTSFENAVFTVSNEKGYSGIGFVFTNDDPYIALDFDKCIEKETGLVFPSIEQNILSLNSYTEISQSGTGIHVIGKGINPDPEGKGSKKGNFEMYSKERYFAITGNIYKDFPKTINDIPFKHLDTLYKKYLLNLSTETKPKTINELKARNNLFLGDEEILSICEKASNSVKFNSLWRGNTIGYPSQSEAELALCNMLAFYTKDHNQLQRLLRASGLYREKMDRIDYIGTTIKKSLDMVREQYDPKAQMRKRWLKRRVAMGCGDTG
jgi:primase-polymerase (primpol)-like protein